jgi:hypothetical protein
MNRDTDECGIIPGWYPSGRGQPARLGKIP